MLLFFIACTPPTTDNSSNPEPPKKTAKTFYTKPYYYPVEELKTGKVYEYSLVQDGQAFVTHYWHLQTEEGEKGQTFLIWKRYNPLFEQDQYIKEWIVQDGVVTKAYDIFIKDSTKQAPTRYTNEVEENIVFPFQATLESNMAYRFSCILTLPPDFLTVKLVRDRKFSGATEYVYKGTTEEAVAFTLNDLYDIENREEGGFWQQEKVTKEIYVKGIGLVQQEVQTKGETATEVTKLSNIYTWEAFEKLKKS